MRQKEYRGRTPVCQTFFIFFSKENEAIQYTLNTGFISLSHTRFRDSGTTCRGRPRADSYRQYRGNALKSGTRLRMLMRRKEHLSNASARSSTVKLAMLSYPSRRNETSHMLRRHEDEHLVAVFGNREAGWGVFFFFMGPSVACFFGDTRRNGIPTIPFPIHLNSQSIYNDIKKALRRAPVAIAHELGYSPFL